MLGQGPTALAEMPDFDTLRERRFCVRSCMMRCVLLPPTFGHKQEMVRHNRELVQLRNIGDEVAF